MGDSHFSNQEFDDAVGGSDFQYPFIKVNARLDL